MKEYIKLIIGILATILALPFIIVILILVDFITWTLSIIK